MKSIFLSGGSGFIGRHFKEYFEKKYTIFAPSSKELDLLDFETIWRFCSQKQIDFIVHCASYGVTKWDCDIYSKNILMYKNLKKLKQLKSCKMFSFGSGAQYDRTQNLCNIKESDFGKYVPKDEYGLSKYEILKDIIKSDDIVSLNIFGCFGRYEIEKRFITYAILCLLEGKKVMINENNTFSYLYVNDLCEILSLFLLNFPSEKSINITPNKSHSMEEVVLSLGKIKQIDYQVLKEGRFYTGDNALLGRILPNYSFTSFDMALKELYKYHKNRGKFKKNIK